MVVVAAGAPPRRKRSCGRFVLDSFEKNEVLPPPDRSSAGIGPAVLPVGGQIIPRQLAASGGGGRDSRLCGRMSITRICRQYSFTRPSSSRIEMVRTPVKSALRIFLAIARVMFPVPQNATAPVMSTRFTVAAAVPMATVMCPAIELLGVTRRKSSAGEEIAVAFEGFTAKELEFQETAASLQV